MNGAAELIVGQVVHDRLRPVRNRFVYPVFCIRVDLARLGELSASRWFGVDKRWRPLALRTADHGPRDGSDLLAWVRNELRTAGLPDDGAVHLQTFPRVFGYVFNPVSFWYCHDANGALRAVLAEVNNTFGEHHRYLVTAADHGPIDAQTPLSTPKRMHVSPFCRIEGGYRFRFRDGGAQPDTRVVGIDYDDAEGVLMHTAIGGLAQPFTAAHLRRAVLRQPLLTVGITARILWQAMRLWLRRVPVHRHVPTSPMPTPSIAPQETPR